MASHVLEAHLKQEIVSVSLGPSDFYVQNTINNDSYVDVLLQQFLIQHKFNLNCCFQLKACGQHGVLGVHVQGLAIQIPGHVPCSLMATCHAPEFQVIREIVRVWETIGTYCSQPHLVTKKSISLF